jgi:hypothetical protein
MENSTFSRSDRNGCLRLGKGVPMDRTVSDFGNALVQSDIEAVSKAIYDLRITPGYDDMIPRSSGQFLKAVPVSILLIPTIPRQLVSNQ